MSHQSIKIPHLLSVSSIALAVALVATPLSFDASDFSVGLSKAEAGKGGGGGGGGNGGGNGGGRGNGNSSSNGGATFGANGFVVNGSPGKSGKTNNGLHPSKLGALNAAHASENALNNASLNSRVGLLATYQAMLKEGSEITEEQATAFLREEVANKEYEDGEMGAVEDAVYELMVGKEITRTDFGNLKDLVDEGGTDSAE